VSQGPQPGPGLRDDTPPPPAARPRGQAAPPTAAVPVVQQQRGRRRRYGGVQRVRSDRRRGPRQRRRRPAVPDPVRGGQRPLRGPGVLFVHVHAGRSRRTRVQAVRGRLRFQRFVVGLQRGEHVERLGQRHQRAGRRLFVAHARAQDIRMQHVQHVQRR